MKIERASEGRAYREEERALVISVPSREVKKVTDTSFFRWSTFFELLAFLLSPVVWVGAIGLGAVFGLALVPICTAAFGWSTLGGAALSCAASLLVMLRVFPPGGRDRALPYWKATPSPAQTLRVSRDAMQTAAGETLVPTRVRVVEVLPSDNGTMRIVATDDEGEHDLLTDLSPDEARRAKRAIDDYG